MCINRYFICIHTSALLHFAFRYASCTTWWRAAHGVGEEPQDGVRWTSPEDARTAEAIEDPAQWSEGPMARNNISTDLVLPPGKPRCTFYYFKLFKL